MHPFTLVFGCVSFFLGGGRHREGDCERWWGADWDQNKVGLLHVSCVCIVPCVVCVSSVGGCGCGVGCVRYVGYVGCQRCVCVCVSVNMCVHRVCRVSRVYRVCREWSARKDV
jgi:hypothetical protein